MMKPPTNYAEWSHCLDRLEQGDQDEQVFSAVRKGKLPWKREITERILRRLIEIIQKRLHRYTEQLHHTMSRGDYLESSLVPAIILMRKNIGILRDFVNLPAFFPSIQEELTQLIDEYAKNLQSQLEEQASHTDRTGRIASILRNHSFTVSASSPSNIDPPIKKRGRRILFE